MKTDDKRDFIKEVISTNEDDNHYTTTQTWSEEFKTSKQIEKSKAANYLTQNNTSVSYIDTSFNHMVESSH